jgi:aldehyde:ferredoxin oxidoreductase
MFDSLTGCTFWRETIKETYESVADWAVEILHAACGWELTPADWKAIERRGHTLERCFSIREGHYIPERDDILPERFFTEPIYNKYKEPKVLDKDEFLKKRKEIYRSYGLRDDGIPGPELLEELGLEFAIPAMDEALHK